MPESSSTTRKSANPEDAERIAELILQGKKLEAVKLYRKSTGTTLKEAVEAIRREWNRIHPSPAPGEAASQVTNARSALVCAAMSGWCGDKASSWPCPVERSTLLAWARSYGTFPSQEGEDALNQLEHEGLFFRIHPDAFEEACFYRSYDAAFIKEIPYSRLMRMSNSSGGDSRAFWQDMRQQFDENHGESWHQEGLCWGQGSESGSAPWGKRLGRRCPGFAKPKANGECAQGLRLRRGSGQP